MPPATNKGASGAAGVFATSRRGGVSAFEVEQMRQRLGARATPAQIAKALGRCEADVRAIMFPQPEEQPAPVKVEPLVFDQPWTDHEIRLLTLMYAEMGCTADACSKALNRTLSATHSRIRKHGLQRPRDAA